MKKVLISKKTLVFVALFFITLFGVFLRLRNIGRDLAFFGDSDRDFLVAKHIVMEGRFTDAFPAALGGNSLLYNSPHYFNFLAVLYFFGQSPEAVVTLLAVLFCFLVPFSFYVGRSLAGNLAGLGLSFTVAFHYLFIYVTHHVYQPYLLFSLVSFSIGFLLVALQKQKVLPLLLAAVLFPLGLHIHYSILPILVPVFCLLFFFAAFAKRTQKKDWLKNILPLTVFLIGILFWLFTINNSRPLADGLWKFLRQSIETTANVEYTRPTFEERISIFNLEVYRNSNQLLWIVTLVVLSVLSVLAYKCRSLPFLENTAAVLLFLSSSVLLTFFSNHIYDSYYTPYYFLFICIVIYVLRKITTRLHSFIFIFFVLLFNGLWIRESVESFLIPVSSDYISARESIKNVVLRVLEDVHQENESSLANLQVEDIMILDKSMEEMSLGWVQPAYYFSLEELTGKNLVSINTDFYGFKHNNIRPRYEPKRIYFVCTETWAETRSPEQVREYCLKSFQEGVADNDFLNLYYYLRKDMSYVKMLESTNVVGLKTHIFKFKVTDAE